MYFYHVIRSGSDESGWVERYATLHFHQSPCSFFEAIFSARLYRAFIISGTMENPVQLNA